MSKSLKQILNKLSSGKISSSKAFQEISKLPLSEPCFANPGFTNLGFARVDTHRHTRKGFPEVIFCERKTSNQVVKIASELLKTSPILLATRASINIYNALKDVFPQTKYHEKCRAITIENKKIKKSGLVAILAAGTSDIPVAEEAAVTASIMGSRIMKLYDVGVAGIHRLFTHTKEISKAKCVIVIAGMEGALASIVGGIVPSPVIAVPTSVGYGASFGGISALLTMLNCCAPGVAVVNIDNGFGAGYMASVINRGYK
ncbi:MAG: nickel pincer cofactor biosynthesis protein LarB [Planctomycetota bacterium]